MSESLTPRLISTEAADLVESFRVTILNGARQSGKTTLLEQLTGALYIDKHDEVVEYTKAMNVLDRIALDPADSLDWLLAFQREHARYFMGRQGEIDEAVGDDVGAPRANARERAGGR